MIETVPTIEIVLMASTGTLLVGLAAAVWLWVRAEARREAAEAERDRMTADRDQMADMRPSWALCGDCEWLVESHRQEMAIFNVRGERQAELMAAVHGALRTHARQKRRAAAAIWELWGERDDGGWFETGRKISIWCSRHGGQCYGMGGRFLRHGHLRRLCTGL